MKAFFDTSVLIPVFLGDHEHHEASIAAFLRFEKKEACCGVHSLAEVYATVTRLPGPHRVSAEQAMLFLQSIRERLTVVTLDDQDYYAAIQAAAEAGIIGGMVYDALLTRCAIKAKAETIFTWNVRHFQRLTPDRAVSIQTP